tara:strand:+ start:1177 stop:1392 length:216 start_codon:yes stop_codon:yes gene_type:complete
MENLINILIERDGLTHDDAKAAVLDCQAELEECLRNNADPFSAIEEMTDIMRSNLGLEPDFMENLIDALIF